VNLLSINPCPLDGSACAFKCVDAVLAGFEQPERTVRHNSAIDKRIDLVGGSPAGFAKTGVSPVSR